MTLKYMSSQKCDSYVCKEKQIDNENRNNSSDQMWEFCDGHQKIFVSSYLIWKSQQSEYFHNQKKSSASQIRRYQRNQFNKKAYLKKK